MNELFFMVQGLLVLAFVLGALRLGAAALLALLCLQAVLANLFVLKQITLFGLQAACGDVFAVGSILTLNLLQEYFGTKWAERAIHCSFFALTFFALMSQLHLLYLPAPSDGTQEAFSLLFSPAPRLFFASLSTYWIVQKIDVRLFGYLQRRFTGKYLLARVSVSLVISQLLDTSLFSFLGLFGLVESIVQIALVSFLIKSAVIALSAPFAALSKRIVQQKEKAATDVLL